MLNGIDRILGIVDRVFYAAANLMFLVMLAINVANIGSRALFDEGLIWVFPWTTVLFVWMVFLGFFVLYHRRQDISIDLLYRNLPRRAQNVVSIVTNLVIVTLMGFILAQLPQLLPRQVGNMDYVGLQRYWLAVPLYVSCALIAIEFLHDTAGRLIHGPGHARVYGNVHGEEGEVS